MPTYSYQCTQCDDRFDIVQAFTDDALTTCERCSGRLRKLFNSVGVVFKGSGFYRTDSRESGKKTGSSNGSSSSDSGSGSSSSEKSTGSSGSGDKSGASSTASTAAASA
ncbi:MULTISPECIES: FmdB family zinc ribbon protein [unclassified Mycobacterium]|uniref:FmdB family zinc ribbon protein n=1 Tax=unclassified Mycobacterium TaxID=2642494 RepID=UPI0006DCF05D|nr:MULTISPECIES: FmdB family zinc ribbon protein [unclassified Mycobacterium]OBH83651.1 FmdB family transcriptional regulator [Mycobacterium sp. E2989]